VVIVRAGGITFCDEGDWQDIERLLVEGRMVGMRVGRGEEYAKFFTGAEAWEVRHWEEWMRREAARTPMNRR
jgi:hypothetical protein